MRARSRTPAIEPSPRFGMDTDVEELLTELEPSTRNEQRWLKDVCLKRDGYKCVVTGSYDLNESTKLSEEA